MVLALRVVSHSEIGLVRKNNQDSGYTSPHLLVVADGMGGAAAGDLASAVAVETLMHVDESTTGPAMLEAMSEAVEDANDRIADLIADDVSLDGMGTTVTAALFDGSRLGLVHIGDSRAYLLRDGRLQRLTHDHSWVQSLVDEGRISEAEAAVHPHRSLLLRVLNGQPGADAEASLLEMAPGDRLMFCSDGLCGLVDDPEIAELLALPDRDEALAALVAAARSEGGVDNITVLVADVVETATGLAGASADAAETPCVRPRARRPRRGGRARRAAPPPGAGRAEEHEDTVITRRPLAPADPGGTGDAGPGDPEPRARRGPLRPAAAGPAPLRPPAGDGACWSSPSWRPGSGPRTRGRAASTTWGWPAPRSPSTAGCPRACRWCRSRSSTRCRTSRSPRCPSTTRSGCAAPSTCPA